MNSQYKFSLDGQDAEGKIFGVNWSVDEFRLCDRKSMTRSRSFKRKLKEWQFLCRTWNALERRFYSFSAVNPFAPVALSPIRQPIDYRYRGRQTTSLPFVDLGKQTQKRKQLHLKTKEGTSRCQLDSETCHVPQFRKFLKKKNRSPIIGQGSARNLPQRKPSNSVADFLAKMRGIVAPVSSRMLTASVDFLAANDTPCPKIWRRSVSKSLIPEVHVQFEGQDAPFLVLRNLVHPLDTLFDLRLLINQHVSDRAGATSLTEIDWNFAKLQAPVLQWLKELHHDFLNFYSDNEYKRFSGTEAKDVRFFTKAHRVQAEILGPRLKLLRRDIELGATIDHVFEEIKFPPSFLNRGIPAADFFEIPLLIPPPRHVGTRPTVLELRLALSPLKGAVVSHLTRAYEGSSKKVQPPTDCGLFHFSGSKFKRAVALVLCMLRRNRSKAAYDISPPTGENCNRRLIPKVILRKNADKYDSTSNEIDVLTFEVSSCVCVFPPLNSSPSSEVAVKKEKDAKKVTFIEPKKGDQRRDLSPEKQESEDIIRIAEATAEGKAPLDWRDGLGYSLLHYAVFRLSVGLIKILCQRRADPTYACAVTKKTPLHLLLTVRGNGERSCRALACATALLSSTLDVFMGKLLRSKDATGNTPLCYAAMKGSFAWIEPFVRAHRAAFTTNYFDAKEISTLNEYFPLSRLASDFDLEAVRLWIENMQLASPNQRFDFNGASLLSFVLCSPATKAQQTSKDLLLTWLLSNGANPLLADNHGLTAFHYAARCGELRWLTPMLDIVLKRFRHRVSNAFESSEEPIEKLALRVLTPSKPSLATFLHDCLRFFIRGRKKKMSSATVMAVFNHVLVAGYWSPQWQDEDGNSVLHYVMASQSMELVCYFLRPLRYESIGTLRHIFGLRNSSGNTICGVAVLEDFAPALHEAFESALISEAALDSENSFGRSLLLLAVESLAACSVFGRSAVIMNERPHCDFRLKNNCIEAILKAIESSGKYCVLNGVSGVHKQSPLHAAVRSEMWHVCSQLFAHGALTSTHDVYGQTPVDVAFSNKNDSSVARLMLANEQNGTASKELLLRCLKRGGAPSFNVSLIRSLFFDRLTLDSEADQILLVEAARVGNAELLQELLSKWTQKCASEIEDSPIAALLQFFVQWHGEVRCEKRRTDRVKSAGQCVSKHIFLSHIDELEKVIVNLISRGFSVPKNTLWLVCKGKFPSLPDLFLHSLAEIHSLINFSEELTHENVFHLLAHRTDDQSIRLLHDILWQCSFELSTLCQRSIHKRERPLDTALHANNLRGALSILTKLHQSALEKQQKQIVSLNCTTRRQTSFPMREHVHSDICWLQRYREFHPSVVFLLAAHDDSKFSLFELLHHSIPQREFLSVLLSPVVLNSNQAESPLTMGVKKLSLRTTTSLIALVRGSICSHTQEGNIDDAMKKISPLQRGGLFVALCDALTHALTDVAEQFAIQLGIEWCFTGKRDLQAWVADRPYVAKSPLYAHFAAVNKAPDFYQSTKRLLLLFGTSVEKSSLHADGIEALLRSRTVKNSSPTDSVLLTILSPTIGGAAFDPLSSSDEDELEIENLEDQSGVDALIPTLCAAQNFSVALGRNEFSSLFCQQLTPHHLELIVSWNLHRSLAFIINHFTLFPQLTHELSQRTFASSQLRFLNTIMYTSLSDHVVGKAINLAREEMESWREHGSWWLETLLDVAHPEHIQRIPAATRSEHPILSLMRDISRSDPTTVRSSASTQNSPLHDAVISNRISVMRHILQSTSLEVDVNVKNSKGRTALAVAARLQRSEAASQLVSTGVDLLVEDVDGMTALHHAAATGSTSIVELIIADDDGPEVASSKSSSPNASYPVLKALQNGKDECAVTLLTSIASESCPKEIFISTGESMIHFAALHGCIHSLEILLGRSSDAYIRAETIDGLTALDYTKVGSSAEKLLESRGVQRKWQPTTLDRRLRPRDISFYQNIAAAFGMIQEAVGVLVGLKSTEISSSLDEQAFSAACRGDDHQLLELLTLGSNDLQRVRLYNIPPVPSDSEASIALSKEFSMRLLRFGGLRGAVEFISPNIPDGVSLGSAEGKKYSPYALIVAPEDRVEQILKCDTIVVRGYAITPVRDKPRGPSYRVDTNNCLLHEACRRGCWRSVRFVIDNNSQAQGQPSSLIHDVLGKRLNSEGFTAFHLAILNKQWPTVNFLLKARIQEHQDLKNKLTPMQMFANSIIPQQMRLALPAGYNIVGTPFLAADRRYDPSPRLHDDDTQSICFCRTHDFGTREEKLKQQREILMAELSKTQTEIQKSVRQQLVRLASNYVEFQKFPNVSERLVLSLNSLSLILDVDGADARDSNTERELFKVAFLFMVRGGVIDRYILEVFENLLSFGMLGMVCASKIRSISINCARNATSARTITITRSHLDGDPFGYVAIVLDMFVSPKTKVVDLPEAKMMVSNYFFLPILRNSAELWEALRQCGNVDLFAVHPVLAQVTCAFQALRDGRVVGDDDSTEGQIAQMVSAAWKEGYREDLIGELQSWIVSCHNLLKFANQCIMTDPRGNCRQLILSNTRSFSLPPECRTTLVVADAEKLPFVTSGTIPLRLYSGLDLLSRCSATVSHNVGFQLLKKCSKGLLQEKSVVLCAQNQVFSIPFLETKIGAYYGSSWSSRSFAKFQWSATSELRESFFVGRVSVPNQVDTHVIRSLQVVRGSKNLVDLEGLISKVESCVLRHLGARVSPAVLPEPQPQNTKRSTPLELRRSRIDSLTDGFLCVVFSFTMDVRHFVSSVSRVCRKWREAAMRCLKNDESSIWFALRNWHRKAVIPLLSDLEDERTRVACLQKQGKPIVPFGIRGAVAHWLDAHFACKAPENTLLLYSASLDQTYRGFLADPVGWCQWLASRRGIVEFFERHDLQPQNRTRRIACVSPVIQLIREFLRICSASQFLCVELQELLVHFEQ